MGVQWTPEQKRAIELPSGKGNILVNAAAGSGKTAVLVERICEKIRLEKRDIDSFLVVTFTKAAAAGMKEKIEHRFRDELEKSETISDQRFWRRQVSLLSMSDITTIDSFCLNTVKNNFQHIGIDPNFFIMDDAEYKLLRVKTAEELFDRLYEQNDKDFLNLIDKYADFRSDDKLIRLIFYIHDFISEFAEPMEWLDDKAAMYTDNMSDSKWAELCIKGYVHAVAKNAYYSAKRLLNKILYNATGLELDFSENPFATDKTREKYGRITDSLEIICSAMEELLALNTIDELCGWNIKYDCGAGLLSENMPSRITNELKEINGFEEFMKEAKDIKKNIETSLSVMALKTPEEFFERKKAVLLKETTAELTKLIKLFDADLMKAKHKRNSYTFLDVEHMTYELFRDNTDIRRDYTEKYYEILIDEYQDTNGLQDAIFTKISHDNIFMVGDLKQSIYLFRGGDPYIFKEKSKLYENDGNNGIKVNLSRNFRSRREIIDSVNDIFGCIMSETVGDVDYSGSERLVCGVDSEKDDFYRSELHIVANIKTDENEESLEYLEAEYIAKRIKELHGKEFFDSKNGISRPLRYSDFTVLLRAVKNRAKVYEDVFTKYGIPFFAEINDYFQNSEIKAMTALISVIDNVRQDVPLITALRSALFNFTDSELAYIKIHFGKDKKCFYECIKDCAASEGYLSGRCRAVTSSISRWRQYTKRKSVANLIWSIYEETGFYDCASAVGGERAQSNLRLLYERAKQYERSGFKGLFSFTRYIESLKDRRDDIAGARIIRHDVVSLMTIHKSKGLEFPVVILGGLGLMSLKVGNLGDSRVSLHKELGIGLSYPDIENGFYGITPFKLITDNLNKREAISENMRLLYVALTRAQYKLIAVAAYNFATDDLFNNRKLKWSGAVSNGKMDIADVMSCSTYGDWLIPAAMKSCFWKVIESCFAESETLTGETVPEEHIVENEQELRDAVYRLLDYEYPYFASTVIPSRTTATEMKEIRRKKQKKVGAIPSAPEFMSKKENAAKRGTAYHNSVAYINLDVIRAELSEVSIASELERLVSEGYVDGRYTDDKMVQKLLKMFRSEQGQRLLQSENVFREKSFQMLIDTIEYNETDADGEKMILQGVIDCFFTEFDGTTVLIDYKTDKIINDDVSAAVENYTLQLELYEKAIEQIAGLKVNEKYLYLFDINKAIKI